MSVIDTKSGLSPEVSNMFLLALKVDNHKVSGDISCTQLISPPKLRMLKKQFKIDEELSDRLWMLLGSAFHKLMELSNIQNEDARAMLQVMEFFGRLGREAGDKRKQYQDVEKYLQGIFDIYFKDVNSRFLYENNIYFEMDGMTVSCTYDLFDKETKTLFDYKLTKSWSWMYAESRLKWESQMNIYAYAMRENGFEVNQAKVIGVFKDWSANEVLRNRDYPDYPIKEMPVTLYSQAQMKDYIKERIRLHKLAETGVDIPCTGKEMWAKSDQFAVKAEGLKRALSGGIFDSKSMAENFIKQHEGKYPKGLHIETRMGGRPFCESYCAARKVCPQFSQYINEINKTTEL